MRETFRNSCCLGTGEKTIDVNARDKETATKSSSDVNHLETMDEMTIFSAYPARDDCAWLRLASIRLTNVRADVNGVCRNAKPPNSR